MIYFVFLSFRSGFQSPLTFFISWLSCAIAIDASACSLVARKHQYLLYSAFTSSRCLMVQSSSSTWYQLISPKSSQLFTSLGLPAAVFSWSISLSATENQPNQYSQFLSIVFIVRRQQASSSSDHFIKTSSPTLYLSFFSLHRFFSVAVVVEP